MSICFPPGTHPLENELNCAVLKMARESGRRLYLVGGYIRDALLKGTGADAKDLDYATAGSAAMPFAELVANNLGGHYVPLDADNDIGRVVLDDGRVLDFSACVGGDIETDLRRRDFTINALAWDPEHPQNILDLAGGLEDLHTRILRTTSEKIIVEDPLRILRAFRFSALLDATIETKTLEWLRAQAQLLKKVAAERINYELFTLLGQRKTSLQVLQMAETGVLEVIFPELSPTHRVTSNAFHHLGLFDHSLETIPQLESKLNDIPDWVHQTLDDDMGAGVTRLAATKVACLLHDIGKPETWVVNPEGRHTFYGHDKLGSDMCELIGQRLKWARPVERFVAKLVLWHLRPGALFHQGRPTDKAVRRFYRSVGDDVPELLLLAFADFGATRGPGLMGDNRQLLEKDLADLLAGYKGYREDRNNRVRLLDGNHIMKLLSLPPGPIVGEILAALDEAQEFKEVSNPGEAERFVKEHYQQKYCK